MGICKILNQRKNLKDVLGCLEKIIAIFESLIMCRKSTKTTIANLVKKVVCNSWVCVEFSSRGIFRGILGISI